GPNAHGPCGSGARAARSRPPSRRARAARPRTVGKRPLYILPMSAAGALPIWERGGNLPVFPAIHRRGTVEQAPKTRIGGGLRPPPFVVPRREKVPSPVVPGAVFITRGLT